jgi:hypothetical protein
MLQAQTILTGVVTDLANSPIPYSTVYLSKTTIGVTANEKGAYTLTIPEDGVYELIASCVGFESHSQIIKADGTIIKLNIKLPERNVLINEVTVKDKDRNRRKNYEQFKKCFIGETANAPYCTIQNAKDLVVYRKSNDSNLVAYSVKPLIITNSALGYEIIYNLKNFHYNLHTQHLRFSGDYYFQDISNKKRKNSGTKYNRLIAYYGSRMHFLRALFTDSLRQENFTLFDAKKDSTGEVWIQSDTIYEKDLRLSLTPYSLALYQPNLIFIKYVDNHPELYPLWEKFRPATYKSMITFSDSLQVYKNGYYPDFYNLTWYGNMGNAMVAELLPYDFVVPKAKAKFVSNSKK